MCTNKKRKCEGTSSWINPPSKEPIFFDDGTKGVSYLNLKQPSLCLTIGDRIKNETERICNRARFSSFT